MMKQTLLTTIVIFSFLINNSFATVYDVNSLGSTNSGAGTSGTLLFCITQANFSAGPHTINFSVAGTINISSSAALLPELIQSITIDATTAPGYAGSPVIMLDGTGLGSGNGLEITAVNCAVYGVEIANFPYRGIYLNGSSANNFMIGTGGKGNIIRSNGYFGIDLNAAHDGMISYNKIGTDAAGSTCMGNGYDGISFSNGANNNQVFNNHISCNSYDGIHITASSGNVIKGNILGPLDNACQGNFYNGIIIEDGSQVNIIGGTSPSDFNKIAGNQYYGVNIINLSSQNLLSGNSYLCNSYGGINLDNANNNISSPVITGASATSVSGSSIPNAAIQVFKSQSTNTGQCAGTPGNQGADFLGSATADAAGSWTLSGTFGGYVVATATDASNNTSEFSSEVYTGVTDTLINACEGSILSVTASFSPSATGICEKACIDFIDQSLNASAWHWSFDGATPAASTLQNPTNICYNDSGVFAVTLVVYDAGGIDSSVAVLYITVHPTPPVPVISINGDTLVSTPAVTYQWYFNSVIIPGATNQEYVVQQTGFYYVEIKDSAGCTSISLISYVDLTEVPDLSGQSMQLLFNNETGSGEVIIYRMNGENIRLEVYDLYGREMLSQQSKISSEVFTAPFDLDDAVSGCYMIRVSAGGKVMVRKVMLNR